LGIVGCYLKGKHIRLSSKRSTLLKGLDISRYRDDASELMKLYARTKHHVMTPLVNLEVLWTLSFLDAVETKV
jgi:hypothetical protein